jgi:hypothetical protein
MRCALNRAIAESLLHWKWFEFVGTVFANSRVVRSQAVTTSKHTVIEQIEQDQEIKDAIRRRTGRRIQELEVKTSGERVLVRGRAPSYYVGQLALCGVWDVIGCTSSIDVRLEVEVPDPNRLPIEAS